MSGCSLELSTPTDPWAVAIPLAIASAVDCDGSVARATVHPDSPEGHVPICDGWAAAAVVVAVLALAGEVVVCVDALRLALIERLIKAIANPPRTSATTTVMTATGTRQSGG